MQALFKEGFEGYFDQHKQREKISTTPFARAPQLNSNEYVQLASNLNQVPKYTEIQAHFLTQYTQYFTQWSLELEQGFNVLLYGLGSKIQLAKQFLEFWDPDLTIFMVNGYNPATNIKELVNLLVQTLVPPETCATWPKQPNERLPMLLDYIHTNSLNCAVIINSIDGVALKNLKIQSMLAKLASSSEVHMLATCDHILAPLLWSADLASQFGFVWHHTPTFTSYSNETSYSDVFSLGQSRASVGVHAVKTVLESLTANAQSMYKLLTSLQYDNMIGMGIQDPNSMGSPSCGISVQDFFKLCVSKFVVSSEVNFKVMFSEFKEHKMLEIQKSKAGVELVFVPYSLNDLEQILSEM